MKRWDQKQTGFTIVELLIVIVVIAILAAISIVAYNGIQNRSNNAAVQSDLRQVGQKLMERKIVDGTYPVFANTPAGPGFNFSINQNSYDQSEYNFYICHSSVDPQSGFAIGARSKSGDMYAWSSTTGGFIDYDSTYWGTSTNICPAVGYDSPNFNFTYGRHTSGGWAAWTQG